VFTSAIAPHYVKIASIGISLKAQKRGENIPWQQKQVVRYPWIEWQRSQSPILSNLEHPHKKLNNTRSITSI